MKKNKLILFDWGDIVESHQVGYTMYDAYRNLFLDLGYDKEEKMSLGKYRLSSIATMEELEDTYSKIKEEYDLKGDFKKLLDCYDEHFDKIYYYKDVRDYEVSLKDRCYIGIFSDLSILDKKRLDKQVGLDNFDYVFLSFELGCQKADKIIFDKVSEKLPFRGADILFIDDNEKYLEMARKLGWACLLATGLELDKIKNKCEEFLRE